jgi:hypothetical protein
VLERDGQLKGRVHTLDIRGVGISIGYEGGRATLTVERGGAGGGGGGFTLRVGGTEKGRFKILNLTGPGVTVTMKGIEATAEIAAGGAHPDLATHDALGLSTDAQLAAHAAEADPHPGYLTPAEGDAAYSATGHAHTHASTTGQTIDDHHARDHASRHQPGGADAMAVDAAPGTGSLRTLGTGATQAAVGSHGPHPDLPAHEAAPDPHAGYQKESEKDQTSGYPGLTAAGFVLPGQLGSGVRDGTKFLRDDGTWQTIPAGGSPPTGTGFRHITAGVEDAAAKLADTADVNDDQITNAKLADMTSRTVKVRSVGTAGDPEDLVIGVNTVLGRLSADILAAQLATAQVADNAITLPKLLDIATASFLGRTTAATGDPEVLTAAQATALLNVFTSTLKGLVPASGGGTTNFLRADGTFAAPPSGGGPVLIAGASGAANSAAAPSETWQRLTANATANATVTLATVMTTTGLPVGTYLFEYYIVWQAAALTTGVTFAVDFTGTVTRVRTTRHYQTTGAAAATGVADGLAAINTGQLVEHMSTRSDAGLLGPNAGVDTINADQFDLIRGQIVVSTTGDLLLRHASEVAASSQVMADTMLLLKRMA